MIILAVALFIAGLILLWQVSQRQKAIGLPAGRVIYSDTRKWGAVEQPLYDPVSGLTGKPDYLVEESNQVIPVEVKSSRITTAPYDAHVYQLAAYCLLVHRQLGKRPPYGVLRYSNRTFAIDYTPAVETTLLNLLEEIRTQDRRKDLPRSHDSPARCHRCGFRNACDQKLM